MANSTNTSKQKAIKQARQENLPESMKGIAGDTLKTLRDDVLKETAKDFMAQLMGRMPAARKVSGELERGVAVKTDNILNGKQQEIDKTQKQLAFERRLSEEQIRVVESKYKELQLQFHAITQEIGSISQSSSKLAQEVKLASLATPQNIGLYHLRFVERILKKLMDFRKDIVNASAWLGEANKRASKKGMFWAQYEKKKGSRLLSPEDFLQRSAG